MDTIFVVIDPLEENEVYINCYSDKGSWIKTNKYSQFYSYLRDVIIAIRHIL
jgi:hypothetical protein